MIYKIQIRPNFMPLPPARYWFNQKGELHREDGPAIEDGNGSIYYYLNDIYTGSTHVN